MKVLFQTADRLEMVEEIPWMNPYKHPVVYRPILRTLVPNVFVEPPNRDDFIAQTTRIYEWRGERKNGVPVFVESGLK